MGRHGTRASGAALFYSSLHFLRAQRWALTETLTGTLTMPMGRRSIALFSNLRMRITPGALLARFSLFLVGEVRGGSERRRRARHGTVTFAREDLAGCFEDIIRVNR